MNLQLLHGHAALSAEFEVLRRNADRLPEPSSIDQDGSALDGHVIAAEWFTYRKRGLLAPFGVGTVDQALLAVLQTKWVFVRLYGLAHKTVIVDEVHAYDTYMTSLLERLLEWLAALGSSVVLLSATLPQNRRRQLAIAYADGLAVTAPGQPLSETAYPRLTWVTKQETNSRCVPRRREGERVVQLQWLDGEVPVEPGQKFPLADLLQEALAAGGCAAVICNTVRRAQQVYRSLQPYFPDLGTDGWPELDLFHSQYLFGEREVREQRARLRFGKEGETVEVRAADTAETTPTSQTRTVERPHRAVIVATQVIEQSLDLDFDLMVTDMAPVDLILQRSGRLHRHEQRQRPTQLRTATLHVCHPRAVAGDVPEFSAADEYIYDAHILLRSWLALQGSRSISIPGEVEGLIEAVYGEERACPAEASALLRHRWQTSWDELQETVAKERAEASNRWLKPISYRGQLWRLMADPREEDAPDFHQAFQALTRLADPSVQVVFLYEQPSGVSIDSAGLEQVQLSDTPWGLLARRMLYRALKISQRRVVFTLLKEEVPAGWQRSSLLRHYRVLTLDQNDSTEVGNYQLRLDPELGLEITARGEQA